MCLIIRGLYRILLVDDITWESPSGVYSTAVYWRQLLITLLVLYGIIGRVGTDDSCLGQLWRRSSTNPRPHPLTSLLRKARRARKHALYSPHPRSGYPARVLVASRDASQRTPAPCKAVEWVDSACGRRVRVSFTRT
ncbi:hypothetical protein OH77DRAFT_1158854 [Trametes cingulata]|nr:hypothetical protein OH77DRAFT_1158854 [Trametes cingulata]